MQHGKGRIATNMYQSVICTLQWAATCPLLKVPLFFFGGGGESGPPRLRGSLGSQGSVPKQHNIIFSESSRLMWIHAELKTESNAKRPLQNRQHKHINNFLFHTYIPKKK